MEPEITNLPSNKHYYPTLAQGFGIFGVSLLLQAGVAVVFGSLMAKNQSLGMLLSYVLIMGLTILFAWKLGNRTHLSFGNIPLHLLPWVILLTPAIGFLMEPLIMALPYAREFQELMIKAIGDNMTFAFLAVAIAAPLLEEILFRGIILEGFLKNYDPWKAIIWSAVIFGLVHLNPYQFIVAFLIGVIMGWIYWKTGSLWLCIIIHFVNNSFGFFASWLFDIPIKEAMTTQEMLGDNGHYGLYLAGAAVVLAFSLFMLHNGMKHTTKS